ncbi:MAG: hypothetical protein ACYDAC_12280 [Candidatus Dormibacteria bacterium]
MSRQIGVDASTMLARCPAGATWESVAGAVAAAGLAVVGLAAPLAGTVGEAVDSGELSHRTVAGVSFTTPRGEHVDAAGRTGKDVTGYDLAGLILGSGGRLGRLESVTLRLEPRGAATPVPPARGPWRGDAGIDVSAAV